MKILYYLNSREIIFECKDVTAARELEQVLKNRFSYINSADTPIELIHTITLEETLKVVLSLDGYKKGIRMSHIIHVGIKSLTIEEQPRSSNKEAEYKKLALFMLQKFSTNVYFDIRYNSLTNDHDKKLFEAKFLEVAESLVADNIILSNYFNNMILSDDTQNKITRFQYQTQHRSQFNHAISFWQRRESRDRSSNIKRNTVNKYFSFQLSKKITPTSHSEFLVNCPATSEEYNARRTDEEKIEIGAAGKYELFEHEEILLQYQLYPEFLLDKDNAKRKLNMQEDDFKNFVVAWQKQLKLETMKEIEEETSNYHKKLGELVGEWEIDALQWDRLMFFILCPFETLTNYVISAEELSETKSYILSDFFRSIMYTYDKFIKAVNRLPSLIDEKHIAERNEARSLVNDIIHRYAIERDILLTCINEVSALKHNHIPHLGFHRFVRLSDDTAEIEEQHEICRRSTCSLL